MKAVVTCLFIITSLFVLLWPFALMLGGFAFDEPAKTTDFELGRIGLVVLLLTYPWGYLLVLRTRWRARKSGDVWQTPRTCFYLLLPFLQVAAIIAFVYFYGKA